MTLFTEKSLNLMPSQALTGLSNSLILDKGAKEVELASKSAKIAKLEGISQIRTPVAGRINVNNGAQGPKTQQESMAGPPIATAQGASLMLDSETNPT